MKRPDLHTQIGAERTPRGGDRSYPLKGFFVRTDWVGADSVLLSLATDEVSILMSPWSQLQCLPFVSVVVRALVRAAPCVVRSPGGHFSRETSFPLLRARVGAMFFLVLGNAACTR